MNGAPIPFTPAPDRPPAPPLAEAAGRVMVRHLASAFRGRKAVTVALLGTLPVVLAASLRSTDPAVLVRIVQVLHLMLLLPILAVSLGAGLFYDEAEEGTLTYLWTTPIPRAAVVFGKWAAVLLLGWVVLGLSLVATFAVTPAIEGAGPGKVEAFSRAAFEAVALGYPAYLGLFLLIGALFRQGLIAGLLYTFVYEFIVARIPAAFKYVSLRYFVDSLVYPVAPDDSAFMGEFEGFEAAARGSSLGVLLGTALVGLVAAIVLAQRKEFRARNVQG